MYTERFQTLSCTISEAKIVQKFIICSHPNDWLGQQKGTYNNRKGNGESY
jgi:hypothetical protein